MDLSLLQSVSLAVAEAREVDRVLAMIVEGLSGSVGLALARIWLMQDVSTASGHPNRQLVLAASAGRSQVSAEAWTGLTGEFRTFQLGARKIGQIGLTGESILLSDLEHASDWIAHPEWAAREQICVFAGHPLLFRGEVLGVLGVFGRQPISRQQFLSLRLFADHAAVAIANARAFEEVNALRERLEQENEYLRAEVTTSFGNIVGKSTTLQSLLQQVELVAPTDASVLITGESGSGKELVARAIHDRSKRRSGPFVKVNCASVPRDLFESEFFGHVKGAFTGAFKDRIGRFQLADGGTLFLDEIGEVPFDLQSKLLRVLQEQEFERVGEDRSRRINVRIVAATNRNLQVEITERRFREDLYFRLNVFPLRVPALRDHKEDIPALAAHFAHLAARKLGRPAPKLTQANLEALVSYPWPGNVRELQNVVERAMILSRDGLLRFEFEPVHQPVHSNLPAGSHFHTRRQVLEAQRLEIEEALRHTGGKIYGADGAAQLLGMRPTTLISKIDALGIDRHGARDVRKSHGRNAR